MGRERSGNVLIPKKRKKRKGNTDELFIGRWFLLTGSLNRPLDVSLIALANLQSCPFAAAYEKELLKITSGNQVALSLWPTETEETGELSY